MSIAATIEVPQTYGYVLLSCVIAPTVSNFVMTGNVVKARKSLDVKYPNLYGIPGFHKNADEFNRIQRGHQNAFELLAFFIPACLVGGTKHPIAVSVYGILFSVGCILYQWGYMDTKHDVATARYKKGGPVLRTLAFVGAIGSVVSLAGSLLSWW
mmetsp:Transcript_13454/g.22911  ORF Transcript_13454/g.22911 Transcript_13454/m.22911 type:complete len:155 (-) Transcript_13454:65-529(-)|eukprot:CAMPEP_0116562706 /NCGR_PEP_ID=MMETSP0397-20121206/12317_1 /TAXON_ID=216820 /ORGANISM="Cyclophora tenuis, Strain ECT3854" /LENGTH=154 /DNA_ID=CAMNT_0004089049 /DNA_START=9 /DNA_END=473 /DNA_ORIENTATION=-